MVLAKVPYFCWKKLNLVVTLKYAAFWSGWDCFSIRRTIEEAMDSW